MFLKSGREEESFMKLFLELELYFLRCKITADICPEQGSPGGFAWLAAYLPRCGEKFYEG